MNDRDKKATANFFGKAAGGYYEERYGGRPDINTFGMLNRLDTVLQLLDEYGVSGGVCLDMGCGPASVYEPLDERGYKYVGLDIAYTMLKEGAERCNRNESGKPLLLAGDVSQTPFADANFDVVLAMGLMDYLDDESYYYQEVRRILKPGGIAIITYSNKRSYASFVRACARPLLKLVGAKSRVLGSAVMTRSHIPKTEVERLNEAGFDTVDAVFGGAHLIPFNLTMPRVYFLYLRLLQKIYRAICFSWGMSSFNLVIKKRGI